MKRLSKRAMTALKPDEKREVERLMSKWDISYNEALSVFLGTWTIDAILAKHGRRPQDPVLSRTLGDRTARFDAMAKRLPGSFENPSV